MRTKFCILAIIFMALIPTTIIAINSGKRTVVKVTYSNQSMEKHPDGKNFDYEKEWNSPSKKFSIGKISSIPMEEDGRHHYFHFHRLRRQRYRAIFKFISKVVLLIIHVATLLCSYIHCLH